MKSKMKKIVLDDYIEVLTDYHSGGSYKTLKEKTKILYEPSYAVMVRTLNFESDDFEHDLIYCDKDSYEFLEYSRVYENDILMNKIANPGSVYIMPKVDYRATCAMNLFLLRFHGINQRYMYYVMKYYEDYIKNQAHGTTTKTITKDEVRNLSFYIHEDPKEQDKVEKILTTIDKRIQNKKRIIAELQHIIDDIYQYWFVQYEFPNPEGKAYKNSGGAMVHNELLGHDIPEGWKVVNLLDVCRWEGTSQPPKSSFIYEPKEGYIRFIQNRDYDNNMHKTYIPDAMANGVCNEYDILMDKYGDAGRIRYGLAGAYNVALAKISVQRDVIREYIRSYLSSEPIYEYLHNSSMASTRASLNENNLSYLFVVVPSDEVLTTFDTIARNIIERILVLKKEKEELIELKEFILPLLIGGQISFR